MKMLFTHFGRQPVQQIPPSPFGKGGGGIFMRGVVPTGT
jgi:hypothetical protein